MPLPDDIREFTPATDFREGDERTQYWIRGRRILWGSSPIQHADRETFRFYLGGFGKDHKSCYCQSTRLRGGRGETFRALNYCYFTDGQSVWTLGGKVKDADAESFEVCDDGVYPLGLGNRAPYGFGKDRQRVYYYDFDGKPNWVRKATPATFVSLNDGHFGKDDQFVFCGASTIAKARVEHWQPLAGFYSRDDRRIFYFNRPMPDADYASFEVLPSTSQSTTQLARDCTHYFENDEVIDADRFQMLLESRADCTP